MKPNKSMKTYPILAAVEFLHDGHALQHKLQAAEPQQHATCIAKQPPNDGKQLATEHPPSNPKTLPIFLQVYRTA